VGSRCSWGECFLQKIRVTVEGRIFINIAGRIWWLIRSGFPILGRQLRTRTGGR